MARTAITPVVLTGKWPTAFQAITFAASNATDGNSYPATGKEILIAFNSDTGAHNVTLNSVADPVTHRTGDITLSVPAGGYAMIGPVDPKGFKNSDGLTHCIAADATVKFAVLQVP